MNRIVYNNLIAVLLSALLLLACKGEDRSHEYVELTEHNTWVMNMMKDKYLWGDLIPEQNYKAYFYTLTKFFSTLTQSVKQNDSWSYCQIDSALTDPHERGNFSRLNSYGMDFSTITDPTKATSRTFARITYVVEGSPAANAGLHRNCFISEVDNAKVTASIATKNLKSGTTHGIIFHHLDTLETGQYVWTDSITATLSASHSIVEPAFPCSKTITRDATNVAYLLATRLLPRPYETESSGYDFKNDMDTKMAALKADNPKEMILDLRLCNHGTIEMAQRLASYIVPTAKKSEVFAQTEWNSRYTDKNTVYKYDTSVSSMKLQRIYIIMSNYTQGAAEWLIRALKLTLGEENVILIGEKSKGQNVMTEFIGHEYGHRLFPAVCYVADATGNYSYGAFSPQSSISESSTTYLLSMKEYGDEEETLLKAALDLIFPEEEAEEE